jgi:hypothetical protein
LRKAIKYLRGETMRKILKVGDSEAVNKSQLGLLKVAKKKLNKFILKDYKDNVGRIGFEVDNFIVGARSYIYGYIISTHKSLVEIAIAKKKKILIYIGNSDAFYEFDPNEIKKTGSLNLRGHEEMYNYDIKGGTRFNPD